MSRGSHPRVPCSSEGHAPSGPAEEPQDPAVRLSVLGLRLPLLRSAASSTTVIASSFASGGKMCWINRVLRNSSDGLFLNEARVVSAEMGPGSPAESNFPRRRREGKATE